MCGIVVHQGHGVGELVTRLALGPVDGVEAEVVSQLRVRARVEQEGNEMRVTEDCGEDKWGLPAAGAFVDVGSVSEHRAHRVCIAGAYGLS